MECYYEVKLTRTYTYVVSANDDQTITISIGLNGRRRRGKALNFLELVILTSDCKMIQLHNTQTQMPYQINKIDHTQKNRTTNAMIIRFNRSIEVQQ